MHMSEKIDKKDEYQIYSYNELGAYLLLDTLKTSKELDTFYYNILGNLLETDKNHELLNTLKEYFNHDESLKVTADYLFIHVNTLKYRMKKVEKITNQDLNTSEGKLNLNLALKIFDMKKFSNHLE